MFYVCSTLVDLCEVIRLDSADLPTSSVLLLFTLTASNRRNIGCCVAIFSLCLKRAFITLLEHSRYLDQVVRCGKADLSTSSMLFFLSFTASNYSRPERCPMGRYFELLKEGRQVTQERCEGSVVICTVIKSFIMCVCVCVCV